jgi:hypothetical protein
LLWIDQNVILHKLVFVDNPRISCCHGRGVQERVVLNTLFFWEKVLGQIEELNPTVLFTYSIFKPLALTYADAGRRTCEIRLCRACPQCQNLHARLCSAASLLVMSEKKSFYPGRRRLSGRWLETVMATDAADSGSVLQ